MTYIYNGIIATYAWLAQVHMDERYFVATWKIEVQWIKLSIHKYVFDKAEGILKQRHTIEGSSYQQKQENKAKMIKTEKKNGPQFMATGVYLLCGNGFRVWLLRCRIHPTSKLMTNADRTGDSIADIKDVVIYSTENLEWPKRSEIAM